ncbi:MAG: HAD family hydrolase [Fidelibacterota bacterium]|nr:MAG: HAD family hydrolase [Candidatus Neomarinimicrobiota bacterium]
MNSSTQQPLPASGSIAVIWDYDCTLVDTRRKNFNVTRAIITDMTGQDPDRFEPLTSLASYEAALLRTANWRDLYQQWFDLSTVDTDRAGALWTKYQLEDTTPTPLLPGIPEVLARLGHLPHGVLSQNGQTIITHVLEANGLEGYFQAVVGFEDVDFARQKPAPDGLLLCLERLTRQRPGLVFYIGDHETDALCAEKGRQALAQRQPDIRLISIGALYCIDTRPPWAERFDHLASQPADIAAIVERYLGNSTDKG